MVVVSNNFDAPAADGVLMEAPGTKLIVNDQELGTGTLYITQNNVVWGGGTTPSGISASTVSLLYPTISLHAIQRDPSPALYLQLSYELNLPELLQSNTDNADDFDDEDIEPVSQLRFIPENENSLQAMYNALTQGQELHPDTEQAQEDAFMDGEDYDDDEEDDAFEDAEESNGSAEQAAARLQHMQLNSNSNSNGTHDNGDVSENGSQ